MVKDYLYRDCSTTLRPTETGFIDKNYLDRNNEGYRFCNVKTRKVKIPQIGDKFSSRHGQKGTVGMILAQEDSYLYKRYAECTEMAQIRGVVMKCFIAVCAVFMVSLFTVKSVQAQFIVPMDTIEDRSLLCSNVTRRK